MEKVKPRRPGSVADSQTIAAVARWESQGTTAVVAEKGITRMNAKYRNSLVEALRDQLVRFAPREKKLEQMARAEQLLAEVEVGRTYPYEFVCYRITQYRPTASVEMQVPGQALKHDLVLLVEDLSDAVPLRLEEASEPVRSMEELSQTFNVSTKTISRWRKQGLVARRFVSDGRKRLGFLESSVTRFVSGNPDRVERGGRFSQLTQQERHEIVSRARRLASMGDSAARITRRLSTELARSVETIRYTLKHFDQKHPEMAIFPNATGSLNADSRQHIYQEYRRGTSAEVLARRYNRTVASIYRIIGEMRAQRIMELPLDCIYHSSFEQGELDREITSPLPSIDKGARRVRVPAGLPPYLAALYDMPLLTREQEQHLFRQLNYLKYKAARRREQLDPRHPKGGAMDEIERLYEEAVRVKNQIVQANLRLVVSISKRHVNASESFFDLVSDGNMSLIRAVEKFDFSRGNKFSTYASWAIMKNFARTIPDEFKRRDRFRTSYEESFDAAEDVGSNPYSDENAQKLREAQIGKILARLDDREQRIIVSRFGLNHSHSPQTLKEVGAELGVTKERVRQIEARALGKLRSAAREEHIELPE